MDHELDAEASISVLLSDSHIGCTRTLQINDEKIDLKIPAGIRDGQKLRIRGKGNYQPGTGLRGDLYIVVRVVGATYSTSTSPAVERDTNLSTPDPWGEDNALANNPVKKRQLIPNAASATKYNAEYAFVYNHYFPDNSEGEYIEVEYQIEEGVAIEEGTILGVYRVSHPDIDGDSECIVTIFAESRLGGVQHMAMTGETLSPGQIVLKITAENGKDIQSLVSDEVTKRMNQTIYLDEHVINEILGSKPERVEFLRWHVTPDQSLISNTYICAIAVHHEKKISRVSVVSNGVIFSTEFKVKPRYALTKDTVIGFVYGECDPEFESLYSFVIDEDASIMVAVPQSEGATHWSIKSWASKPGEVAKGSPIAIISEHNYETGENKSYQISAASNLTIGEFLAEEGSLVQIGDPIMKVEQLALMTASELFISEEYDDCDEGLPPSVWFTPLYEGNISCSVASVSDCVIKGRAKKGEELLTLECYEVNDESSCRNIATLVAEDDIVDISIEIQNGNMLYPGDTIFRSTTFEKKEPSEVLNVLLSCHDRESEERITELISCARSARSFDIRSVLTRISMAKKELIQNHQYASAKKNAAISAGTAIASIGASVVGLGIVASAITLMKMAHQASSTTRSAATADLDEPLLIAEEIREMLLNTRSRLGEAQGRFIGADGNSIKIYSIMQSAARGMHLVELDFACNTSFFKSDALNDCLINILESIEYDEVLSMLLPTEITPLKGARTVTQKEASEKDEYYSMLSSVGLPMRAETLDSSTIYLYKMHIPPHSDF